MATVRVLPSGNWQASVLLDGGARTTSTHATVDEAKAWADAAERERDERRFAARGRERKSSGDMVLNELDTLVTASALTAAQKRRLASIAAAALLG